MFGLMPRKRERLAEGVVARREPMPLDLFRRDFATLFDRVFGSWPLMANEPLEMWEAWGLELDEEEKEVVIRAEVPGFEPGEVDVRLAGNLLTIRAEHKEPETKEEKKVPRRYGRMEKSITLPTGLDLTKVEARYRNGVLEVHIPRSPEAEPKVIEVKV